MNSQAMTEYATEYIARTRYGIDDIISVEMVDEYETVINCESGLHVAKYEPRETGSSFPKFELAGIFKIRIVNGERCDSRVEMVRG